jgi:predicted RNA methylase
VKENIKINQKDLIIEPSAGNGSFILPIKSLSRNVMFFDIKPNDSRIKKIDFLKISEDVFTDYDKMIHVIGNPPFGFKGSLAIKFIKKACEFCDSFSFILPKSFAKASMQVSVPSYFHLKHSSVLPANSFEYKGQDYDIPCVFQIWEKRGYKRKKIEKPKANGYSFVGTAEGADFAIRRVGSLAGKITYTNLVNKNINSHNFKLLEDRLTEPTSSRLARNESIEQTYVEFKKNIPKLKFLD